MDFEDGLEDDIDGIYLWDDNKEELKIMGYNEINNHFDIIFTRKTKPSKKISEKFEISIDTVEDWRTWRGYLKNEKNSNLFLKKINEKVGYGVFALKDIKENSFICAYGGKLKKLNSITAKNNSNYEIQTCYDDLVIDGFKYRSLGGFLFLSKIFFFHFLLINKGFINHSPNANVELSQFVFEAIPVCIFHSIKEIKKGISFSFSFLVAL